MYVTFIIILCLTMCWLCGIAGQAIGDVSFNKKFCGASWNGVAYKKAEQVGKLKGVVSVVVEKVIKKQYM